MAKTKMDFTDIELAKNIEKDFLQCCDFFVSKQNLIVNGKQAKHSIWFMPDLVRYFVKPEANKAILKNVFETICSYEKKYPGVGLAFLQIANNGYNYSVGSKTRGSTAFILRSVEKLLECDHTLQILRKIKTHGNPQMSVSVQRGPYEKTVLRFNNLPSVRLQVHPNFRIKNNQFKNCHFFMVNGAVSKPSEITKLLNESFENKDKCYFIVCKSFNSEVISTLQANYDRDIVNVVPIQFGYDIESINSLPDLVSIVGGLPYSPDLGDVLSAAALDRMGFCDAVTIDKNLMKFQSKNVNKNHIKSLSQKIQTSNEETRKIIAKRLIGLRGNSCNVFLPEGSKYNHTEISVRHGTQLLSNMSKVNVVQITTGKKKFYVPSYGDTIMTELMSDVKNLLSTKIYLPRRTRDGKSKTQGA